VPAATACRAGLGGGDPGPKRPWGPPGGATHRGTPVVGGGGPPKAFVCVGGWSSVPGVRVFPPGQQHMPTPPEYRRPPLPGAMPVMFRVVPGGGREMRRSAEPL